MSGSAFRHLPAALVLTLAALSGPLWLRLATPDPGPRLRLREVPTMPPVSRHSPTEDPRPVNPEERARDPLPPEPAWTPPAPPPVAWRATDAFSGPAALPPPGPAPLDLTRLPVLAPAQPAAPGPVEIPDASAVDQAPRARLAAEPVYPFAATLRRTEGFVVVSFVVTADGAVRDARVEEAQPPGVFDAAAVQAVRGWRFEPGRHGGRPVEVRVRQRIVFRLS